jgi:hypothetical protein
MQSAPRLDSGVVSTRWALIATPVTISDAAIPPSDNPGASEINNGSTTPEELEKIESKALNAKINGKRIAFDAVPTIAFVIISIAPACDAISIYITIPVTIRIVPHGTVAIIFLGSTVFSIRRILSAANAMAETSPPYCCSHLGPPQIGSDATRSVVTNATIQPSVTF